MGLSSLVCSLQLRMHCQWSGFSSGIPTMLHGAKPQLLSMTLPCLQCQNISFTLLGLATSMRHSLGFLWYTASVCWPWGNTSKKWCWSLIDHGWFFSPRWLTSTVPEKQRFLRGINRFLSKSQPWFPSYNPIQAYHLHSSQHSYLPSSDRIIQNSEHSMAFLVQSPKHLYNPPWKRGQHVTAIAYLLAPISVLVSSLLL